MIGSVVGLAFGVLVVGYMIVCEVRDYMAHQRGDYPEWPS